MHFSIAGFGSVQYYALCRNKRAKYMTKYPSCITCKLCLKLKPAKGKKS